MDKSIQSKDYPNRTAVIREAVAELIVNDKGELRSSLRREPSLFRGHVAEIRKELGLERRFS
jgi:Arc/MetJ-type ribon-helix-helix transcriptional regulator